MEVMRLTNLGNLTLRNMLNLDNKYGEIAGLKRAKMAKLWESPQLMDHFQVLFSSYHSDTKFVIFKEGSTFIKIAPYVPFPILLTPDLAQAMTKFEGMGLARKTIDDRGLDYIIKDIKKDEYLNPIKYLNSTAVELTGLCNLKCNHCYRGGSRKDEYGLPAGSIKEALVPLLRAGINSLGFTGGEVSLRMEDLLDIIDYASSYMELKGLSERETYATKYGKEIHTVEDLLSTETYTSFREMLLKQLSIPEKELRTGDWLISDKNTVEDVDKIVRRFAQYDLKSSFSKSVQHLDNIIVLTNGFIDDQESFVKSLKSYGNITLQVSLDSYNEKITDMNRGREGVFQKVRQLAELSIKEGLPICVRAHDMGGVHSKRDRENHTFFNKVDMSSDSIGYIGNNSDQNVKSPRSSPNSHLGDLSKQHRHGKGWCKGFTRPTDLNIRPTGYVGSCNMGYIVPEQFGNIKEKSMTEILNGIQDTEIYRMFKDGRIEKYQHMLDKSLFPSNFGRSCEPVILTMTFGMIYENLLAQKVPDAIRQANISVAKMYKFIK